MANRLYYWDGSQELPFAGIWDGVEVSPDTPEIWDGSSQPATPPALSTTEPVRPDVETAKFPVGTGDIADDSTIIRDDSDPTRSVVVAASKHNTQGGMVVYGLAGQQLQWRQDGKINNVDHRKNVVLGGVPRTVVAGSQRDPSTNGIRLYTYDAGSRTLSPVNLITLPWEPYGCAMYQEPDGTTYVFVSRAGDMDSEVRQYRLNDNGSTFTGTLVRTISLAKQAEGMCADDQTGNLYLAVEDVGLYLYSAAPDGGTSRTTIGTAGDGNLVADIEGVTIARYAEGYGYVIASSQGDSSFHVYELGGSHAHLRRFTVGSNGAIDATQSTDGLDVIARSLGPAYPHGLLVVHDGGHSGTSNLKYVPLEQVLHPIESSTEPDPTPPPPGSFLPTADATVRSETPNFSDGASLELESDGADTSNGDMHAFLKFNLSALGAETLTDVKLELLLVNGSTDTQTIYAVADNSWTETDLTWANQPTAGAAIGTITASNHGERKIVTLDTATVQAAAGGMFSIVIKNDGTNGIHIASRESDNPPVLKVTTGSTPPPDENTGEPAGDYGGWDPQGSTRPGPPPNGARPYYTNTGLFLQADRDSLTTHTGDFTTSKNGQVVELLDIHGDVIVQHSGVVFKRCRIRDAIKTVDGLSASDTIPEFWFCEVIKGNGKASTSSTNLTRGLAYFVRCNISGYIDGLALKVGNPSSSQLGGIRWSFVHDANLVPSDGLNTPSHNDVLFQANNAGNGCQVEFIGNTVFGSGVNNHTATEGWTWKSGPHWNDAPTPEQVTFPNASTGGYSVGRMTSLLLVKLDANVKIVMEDNLFRGAVYSYVNSKPGNRLTARNNMVDTSTVDSSKSIATCLGNPDHFDVWTGNVDMDGQPFR